MQKKTVIIGSGLGGLLTGYLLSKEGINVTVLEKHRKFGGCLQSFKRDRYSFDTGIHYIGSMSPGQTLHNYWKYFGLTDNLDLLKMDTDGFDRISFGGNASVESVTDFPLAQGFANFREQLLPFFTDADPVLRSYIHKLKEITDSHPLYNLELPSKSGSEKYSIENAYSFLQTLSPNINDPASGIRHLATGIQLTDILAGNNFLYAGNPFTTPLSQFGLINHSFISSAWRLAGGSQQIADILVEGIRAHGGIVLAKKKVTRISRTGDLFDIATKDGDRFEAMQVISGIHPAATLQLMKDIPIQRVFRERIAHLPNTISVFSVYLGLKPDTFPFMNHNVYHHTSPNVWTDRGSMIPFRGWPSQFLFMTPPENGQGEFADTAVIMAPMEFNEVMEWEDSESGARNKSYFVFKAKKAKLLLDAVYERFPVLKEAVVTIEISTPLTWRDYTGTVNGSMYGVVKDVQNPMVSKIHSRTKIPGLFFTGQNVNLHGALGVTIGSVMTCGEILGLPKILETIKKGI